jgi:L-ascorbate metabolism protein UlaG (beta-lactamase superfamily)
MAYEGQVALQISRILHAGYVFEYDGVRIAFDPIFENPFSGNCHAFPDVAFDRRRIGELNLPAVFISHHHDDHCSLESLDLLDRRTPLFIYCLHEELFAWVRELGFTDVRSLMLDQPVHVGPFEVVPRRALDADVDSIFHIKVAGLNVLNVVDSWIDEETLSLLARSAPWDVVLWPFQTMRELEVIAPARAAPASGDLPPEWIEQLKVLRPKVVVPSSCQFVFEDWSWYNRAFFPVSYLGFQQQVEAVHPHTRVVRMDPSVSFAFDGDAVTPAAPLGWVIPVGEQRVDYAYDPELSPPAMTEIARRFPPLTTAQSEAVERYCRTGLLDRYRELGAPAEEYFRKTRIWKLSVYDHSGSVRNFHYRLEEDAITAVSEDDGPVAWTTEVAQAKLHAALFAGETLTSMYLRINDVVFAPALEEEIQDADVVDDPLVRCLFNGIFGAYQRAQLERLKARASGPEGGAPCAWK